MEAVFRLQGHLRNLGRVVLGYSGGVDSAVLAVAGTRALGPDRFLAVIGRSASYPEVQWRGALTLALQFDIPVHQIETHELDDPRYLANPVNRCYFCKAELWSRVREVATARGFDVIIDGTNTDDLREHRPGHRPAPSASCSLPLAELGFSKLMVRAAAQDLGLPIWDAPAAPCLSSRVQYDLPITRARLKQVESGEAFLRDLGVRGDLRVRHLGPAARIEVGQGEFDLVDRHWADIVAQFTALGFERVERDARGYRRGSLLTAI